MKPFHISFFVIVGKGMGGGQEASARARAWVARASRLSMCKNIRLVRTCETSIRFLGFYFVDTRQNSTFSKIRED